MSGKGQIPWEPCGSQGIAAVVVVLRRTTDSQNDEPFIVLLSQVKRGDLQGLLPIAVAVHRPGRETLALPCDCRRRVSDDVPSRWNLCHVFGVFLLDPVILHIPRQVLRSDRDGVRRHAFDGQHLADDYLEAGVYSQQAEALLVLHYRLIDDGGPEH